MDQYDCVAKIRAVAAIFINQNDGGFEMTADEAHGVSVILHEVADELTGPVEGGDS